MLADLTAFKIQQFLANLFKRKKSKIFKTLFVWRKIRSMQYFYLAPALFQKLTTLIGRLLFFSYISYYLLHPCAFEIHNNNECTFFLFQNHNAHSNYNYAPHSTHTEREKVWSRELRNDPTDRISTHFWNKYLEQVILIQD